MKKLLITLYLLTICSTYAVADDNVDYIENRSTFPYSKTVKLKNREINIYSDKCVNNIESVNVCENATLTISISKHHSKQNIKLNHIFINTEKTVFSGKLDNNYSDDQYTIILSDVNNDGSEDLIIQTGKEGNYGGPSFDVFIYQKDKKQFIYNKIFSNLTKNAGNLFRTKGDKLYIFSTSGCCERSYLTYKIQKNSVKLIRKEVKNI